MAESQKDKLLNFNKDYREGLDRQKEELEQRRLMEHQRHLAEIELKQKQEEEARLKEQQEVERRRLKNIEIQQDFLNDLEESKRRKAILAEEERLNDERIQALQTARRQAEIAREEEEKRLKKEKEKDMMKMKAAVEQERELMLKREHLRMVRQQEEEERAWRAKELQKAQAQRERDEKIMRLRDIQIEQRQEDAARAVEKERTYWNDVQKTWHQTVQQEAQENELKAKVNFKHLIFTSPTFVF